MSFSDSINSAIGSLASNADKIISSYGGILQRKNDLAMMRARQQQQLAALKAQTAVNIAQQKAATPSRVTRPAVAYSTSTTPRSFTNMGYLAIGAGFLAVAAFIVLSKK